MLRVVDETGATMADYTYDAWGNFTYTADPNAGANADIIERYNPVTYRGYYYDTDLEMYYLQSRYYNPQWGRFLNADDTFDPNARVLTGNLFSYCANDPVNLVDYDGHFAEAIATLYTGSKFLAAAATLGGANFWNPAGLAVLTGIAIGVGGYIIYKNVKTSARTMTLSDVKAKLPIPGDKVYYLAYVTDKGELKKVGSAINFVEALTALGITGATNSLSHKYIYNKKSSSDAQRELQSQGKFGGIYTHDQAHAKALAVVFSCTEPPEVHASGMYGHYNDPKHAFHVWFGGKITY